MLHYEIGDLHLHYCGDFPLTEDGIMERFRIQAPSVPHPDTVTCRVELQSLEHFRTAVVRHYNGLSWLMEQDSARFLMFPWAWLRFGYAVPLASLRERDHIRCLMAPEVADQIPLTTTRFFSTVGLHSKLLQRGAPVLHASCIEYRGRAILFTAPSGTGKSTQADLWAAHTGAEIINGDRVLLRKRNERWHAFGYPCCGSSDICLNRTAPLAAIVVLAQGPENRVEQIPPGERVRTLFAGIEHYLWDQDETEQSLSLAQSLAMDVPVLRLTCRPDADAVRVLHDHLEQEALL